MPARSFTVVVECADKEKFPAPKRFKISDVNSHEDIETQVQSACGLDGKQFNLEWFDKDLGVNFNLKDVAVNTLPGTFKLNLVFPKPNQNER
jgi:hypothetical protein